MNIFSRKQKQPSIDNSKRETKILKRKLDCGGFAYDVVYADELE